MKALAPAEGSRTRAERAIRWSTIAAVTGVAVVAGWVSYEHALAVVRVHGEGGAVAQVYPVTVDGLIYSASMVLLDAARRGVRAPGLARWLLAAGIGATLAANVAAGLHFGPVGAVVAAWPALALVGSYELLMLIIRSSAAPTGAGETVPGAPGGVPDAPGGVPGVPASLNGHAHKAAELFAADLAAGRVPGIRRIRTGLHVGQDKASQVQAYLRTVTLTQ
ncbi:MAG TPA: DUF2637 domain-containing protein [Streptosporangiaceae bacterium]|nr:DUF2637 domain-containing protein [Streptosporangiaceae bacterium]